MSDHQSCSAAIEHDTCRFCGTVASPNDEPNCSTLQQAYAQTPTRPYGCPWFDKDSRKQWPKDRAEMSNLKDPERALVERCRADGFDYTAGCNLVDLVRRAGLTLSFTVAQTVSMTWPKALNVTRHADNSWHGDISFARFPTDEELKALHEFLRVNHAGSAQPPAAPVETSGVMQAAETAAQVVEGWSDSKREYAERVMGGGRPQCSAANAADILMAAKALDYLSDHSRPNGGQENYNAEHLVYLAEKLRKLAAHLTNEPQTLSMDVLGENVTLRRALCDIILNCDNGEWTLPSAFANRARTALGLSRPEGK